MKIDGVGMIEVMTGFMNFFSYSCMNFLYINIYNGRDSHVRSNRNDSE